MAQLIDGKAISQQIREKLTAEVARMKEAGITPKLAVVQVGDDPASTIYVRNKKKACEQIGIDYLTYNLDKKTTEQELLDLIDSLNRAQDVHGILVQLPLPEQINEKDIILAISPDKDVDGFHPVNMGRLATGEDGFVSCTPAGVIELLKYSGVEIDGKSCTVVGRSNNVGKPAALLMLRENATVTICHSHTRDLKEKCKNADILICAIGKPKFINHEYIKKGAVVIDIGIHRLEGKKLCGDVDREDVMDLVSKITPVPGGVGPMTVTMLMANCVKAARRLTGFQD